MVFNTTGCDPGFAIDEYFRVPLIVDKIEFPCQILISLTIFTNVVFGLICLMFIVISIFGFIESMEYKLVLLLQAVSNGILMVGLFALASQAPPVIVWFALTGYQFLFILEAPVGLFAYEILLRKQPILKHQQPKFSIKYTGEDKLVGLTLVLCSIAFLLACLFFSLYTQNTIRLNLSRFQNIEQYQLGGYLFGLGMFFGAVAFYRTTSVFVSFLEQTIYNDILNRAIVGNEGNGGEKKIQLGEKGYNKQQEQIRRHKLLITSTRDVIDRFKILQRIFLFVSFSVILLWVSHAFLVPIYTTWIWPVQVMVHLYANLFTFSAFLPIRIRANIIRFIGKKGIESSYRFLIDLFRAIQERRVSSFCCNAIQSLKPQVGRPTELTSSSSGSSFPNQHQTSNDQENNNPSSTPTEAPAMTKKNGSFFNMLLLRKGSSTGSFVKNLFARTPLPPSAAEKKRYPEVFGGSGNTSNAAPIRVPPLPSSPTSNEMTPAPPDIVPPEYLAFVEKKPQPKKAPIPYDLEV